MAGTEWITQLVSFPMLGFLDVNKIDLKLMTINCLLLD